MNAAHRLGLTALALVSWAAGGGLAAESDAALSFRKHVIDSGFPAISAAAVDVDGDGALDVVAGGGPSGGKSPWSNLIYWYRAPDWVRRPVDTIQPDAIILHVEAVDFSHRAGDRPASSAAEVVVTAGGEIRWYRYDRESTAWTGTSVVTDVPYAHGIAAGDIDRDGYADLLVPLQPTAKKGGAEARRGLLWACNPGAGTGGGPGAPWPKRYLAQTFDIDGWLHYVRLVDVNGDGRLDALHGSQCPAGWFGYWLQPPDLAEEWEFHALNGPFKGGTNLDGADLNGDGLIDLVGAEGHGTGLWWFPAPGFAPARLDDTLKSAHCLALADFDADGRVDVASCGYESREVAVFRNRGEGRFDRVLIDTNQCAYDALAVDLNADGRRDILLSGQNSTNLVWYENLVPRARE